MHLGQGAGRAQAFSPQGGATPGHGVIQGSTGVGQGSEGEGDAWAGALSWFLQEAFGKAG